MVVALIEMAMVDAKAATTMIDAIIIMEIEIIIGAVMTAADIRNPGIIIAIAIMVMAVIIITGGTDKKETIINKNPTKGSTKTK